MSVYRVIATDLDGTLLRSSYEVSERTVAALDAVQEAGAVVVPVTARSPRSTRDIAAQHGIRGYAICGNGAMLYDLTAHAIVDHRPLEAAIAQRLIRALREAAPGALFGAEVEMRFVHEPGYRFSVRVPDELRTPMDALEELASPVSKLILKHPEHALDVLLEVARSVAGEEAHVTTSGGDWVEIQAIGVTKGATLAAFCDRIGVPRDEVIAFGDHANDLPMLEWAGRAVVPANGQDVARAAADEVCPSNDEDGVAQVLERLLSEGRIARA